jgi:hypothetical protein
MQLNPRRNTEMSNLNTHLVPANDVETFQALADDFAMRREFELAFRFQVKATKAMQKVAAEFVDAVRHELDRTESARAAAVREIACLRTELEGVRARKAAIQRRWDRDFKALEVAREFLLEHADADGDCMGWQGNEPMRCLGHIDAIRQGVE